MQVLFPIEKHFMCESDVLPVNLKTIMQIILICFFTNHSNYIFIDTSRFGALNKVLAKEQSKLIDFIYFIFFNFYWSTSVCRLAQCIYPPVHVKILVKPLSSSVLVMIVPQLVLNLVMLVFLFHFNDFDHLNELTLSVFAVFVRLGDEICQLFDGLDNSVPDEEDGEDDEVHCSEENEVNHDPFETVDVVVYQKVVGVDVNVFRNIIILQHRHQHIN